MANASPAKRTATGSRIVRGKERVERVATCDSIKNLVERAICW